LTEQGRWNQRQRRYDNETGNRKDGPAFQG
jgi:hypothetical protein